MRIGINDGTLNDGSLDRVIENARTAEAQGFASHWISQIFGHSAMTTLALIGREVCRAAVAANPQGIEFLHRDVLNVRGWFARRGYDIDAEKVFADVLCSLRCPGVDGPGTVVRVFDRRCYRDEMSDSPLVTAALRSDAR